MLVGQDPLDREKFWQWMWVANTPENVIGVVDMALWDLAGRAAGLPVSTSCSAAARDRVKAYASTYPNMGSPEDYAAARPGLPQPGLPGLQDPPLLLLGPGHAARPAPGRPSHMDWDIATCRAVREAVGDDMVLMYDPWGTYHTAGGGAPGRPGAGAARLLLVRAPDAGVPGREPTCAWRGSCASPSCSPEIAEGPRLHPRRLDPARGLGHEPDRRAARRHHRGPEDGHRLRGVRRQVRDPHERLRQPPGAGRHQRGHLRVLREGPARPGRRLRRRPTPTCSRTCDPLDADGYVTLPQGPGLGYDIVWDYIEANAAGGARIPAGIAGEG